MTGVDGSYGVRPVDHPVTRRWHSVGVASEMPADLPADVTVALVQRGPSLGDHDVILLPHETRHGHTQRLLRYL